MRKDIMAQSITDKLIERQKLNTKEWENSLDSYLIIWIKEKTNEWKLIFEQKLRTNVWFSSIGSITPMCLPLEERLLWKLCLIKCVIIICLWLNWIKY